MVPESLYRKPQSHQSSVFDFVVLGILSSEKFSAELLPNVVPVLARFARVRIEDSSRNRFASTTYFAQSQTTLFPRILFMGGNNRGGTFRGEFSEGNFPERIFRGNFPGEIFRGEFSGGEYSGHRFNACAEASHYNNGELTYLHGYFGKDCELSS